MDEVRLPNARATAVSDSPRFHRAHNSRFWAALNPSRLYFLLIEQHSISLSSDDSVASIS